MRGAATVGLFQQLSRARLTLGRSMAVFSLALALGGCTSAGAPAIALFGAYFPSWLACTLAGIVGAVVVRLVFIPLGIDDALPFRLPIYVAVAACLGFLVSLLGFGR